MPDCPDTEFESSGTADELNDAFRLAWEEARETCEQEVEQCPLPEQLSREDHENPDGTWTVEMTFRCRKGP